MTKQEFIEKTRGYSKNWSNLPKDWEKELESVIQSAVNEHNQDKIAQVEVLKVMVDVNEPDGLDIALKAMELYRNQTEPGTCKTIKAKSLRKKGTNKWYWDSGEDTIVWSELSIPNVMQLDITIEEIERYYSNPLPGDAELVEITILL
jgi:hypothetical protein